MVGIQQAVSLWRPRAEKIVLVFLLVFSTQKKAPRSEDLSACIFGAGNEIRTRDVNLGKVALYH